MSPVCLEYFVITFPKNYNLLLLDRTDEKLLCIALILFRMTV